MKQKLFLFLLFPSLSFANLESVTWKGTYHDAIPNKKDVSLAYCKAHTPGSFIHVVKAPISRQFITDKGITLDRGTFHLKKTHHVYLLHGDFWATGKTNDVSWQDHIYWYATKLTEAGITRGVWSSNECKGFYTGIAIK
jgi:hypothetical protein